MLAQPHDCVTVFKKIQSRTAQGLPEGVGQLGPLVEVIVTHAPGVTVGETVMPVKLPDAKAGRRRKERERKVLTNVIDCILDVELRIFPSSSERVYRLIS
jgi:hypothetical protein